jgi:serine/threonine-protein kinase
MGVVVEAEHLQLRQRVALKLLLPEMLQRPDVVVRFEREARATARLKNEHVARILDVGTLDTGGPYIVMEYLEGSDLGAVLATEGIVKPEDAVHYVLQACEALAEAHGVGIIHRDLKPQNLFLTRTVDGAPLVKVLDFGVSRFADAADVHLTRTSAIVGSPAYMSPEQMRAARNANERSDIWSLGVILYELLTGQLPFAGETMTDLFAVVMSSKPASPDALRPAVSAGLAGSVLKCLRIEPALRPSSVAELALAIAPFGGPTARPLSERILAVTRATRPEVAEASVAAASGDSDSRWRAGTSRTVATEGSTRRRVHGWIGAALLTGAGLLGVVLLASGRRRAPPTGAPDPAARTAPVVLSAPSAPSALPTIGGPSPQDVDQSASVVDAATSASARPAIRSLPWKPTPAVKPPPSAHGPGNKDDPFQSRTSF